VNPNDSTKELFCGKGENLLGQTLSNRLLIAFRNHATAQGLRDSTIDLYLSYIRKLDRINQSSVDMVIGHHNNNVSRSALKYFCTNFLRLYDERGNPLINIKMLRGTRIVNKRYGLSPEEFERLINVMSARNGLFTRVLRESGFRVSEVCKDRSDKDKGLKPSRIFYENSTIRLKVKGGHWDDAVLSRGLIEDLSNYVKYIGIKWTDWVFPFYRDNAWRILKDASEAAGIRHVHPHLLKHTTARDAYRSGLQLHEVKILLHHQKINVTEEHYTNPIKRDVWDQLRRGGTE
jgi:integrase